MKKIIILITIILSFIACEKDNNEKEVTYLITDSDSGFDVTYKNKDKETVFEKVLVASSEDKWKYFFKAVKGDIVYVSANYTDINSAIKVKILIDGKVYKEAATKYDTTSFVTVSGTIPY
ncbi:MAG: hypothetical protein K8R58_06475 [Bacteroidales bacterium]|nr:hypothetical protein [Bacteroidales bacterium]